LPVGIGEECLKSANERGKCLRIQWQTKWSRGAGCSITVSAALAGVVAPVVERVSAMMGWQYEE
jgi:hypothetical protein